MHFFITFSMHLWNPERIFLELPIVSRSRSIYSILRFQNRFLSRLSLVSEAQKSRKKPDLVNTMVVPAVRCCFWPNTAECLEPCEPEHYRDEGRIQHLFVHISGLLVRTAPSRCCSITFDARGFIQQIQKVVHFSSCHRMKQLTSMSTKRYCNICSEQSEHGG